MHGARLKSTGNPPCQAGFLNGVHLANKRNTTLLMNRVHFPLDFLH